MNLHLLFSGINTNMFIHKLLYGTFYCHFFCRAPYGCVELYSIQRFHFDRPRDMIPERRTINNKLLKS